MKSIGVPAAAAAAAAAAAVVFAAAFSAGAFSAAVFSAAAFSAAAAAAVGWAAASGATEFSCQVASNHRSRCTLRLASVEQTAAQTCRALQWKAYLHCVFQHHAPCTIAGYVHIV